MKYIDKKIAETPLEALQRFRQQNPTYKDTRLSYAGRLDPMASGKLLILEGEENDRREEFLERDKTYEFQILFGVSTDTYDLLGLITDIEKELTAISVADVEAQLEEFIGEWEMMYPPYSSKTVAVDGEMVPLWQLARVDNLPEMLPEKSVEIYEVGCVGLRKISGKDVLAHVREYVPEVSGDFRQQEIIDCWEGRFSDSDVEFLLGDCELSCSAGTYVRRLAQVVGRRLKTPSLAFSIKRVSVG